MFTDAVSWLRSALLGTVATTVAVLAIAAIGLLMLNGRVPARRAPAIVLGCFILFSAGTIADALVGGGRGQSPDPAPPPPQQSYTPAIARPVPYDPYAGASVPNRQPEQPIIK